MDGTVTALTVYNGLLIAGGGFIHAGGVSVNRIAQWNGTSWSALGSGMQSGVEALAVYGGALIAGGGFIQAGGVSANRIAQWNGTSWSPLGSGMQSGVEVLAVCGSALIAGGGFIQAGGVSANRIAQWNGTSWSALGAGMDSGVEALAVYGDALVAGGGFIHAGDIQVMYIARWDEPPPIVQVTSPNGGEAYKAGSTQAITWTATSGVGVTSVDLAYSTDGGATFQNVIAMGLANSGSYSWLVPNTPTTRARVHVTAHDAAGKTGSDASDADFTIDTWVIIASASAGGSISPSGTVGVVHGGSQGFAITSDTGYHVANVLVDGSSVGVLTNYTFTNVTANHTIGANFALNAYTITASAGPNGTITPAGAVTVAYGSDRTFTMTPNPGYSVTILRVDGGLVSPAGSYTFAHVTANHTLEVFFADVTAPEVHVVEPNGGDTLIVGMDVTLRWTATDPAGVKSVDLLLSRDNGATQEEIAAGVPNTGSYDWHVTSPAPCAVRPAALLTAVARDSAGNVGSDASDAPFALYDLATGTLLSLFEANVVDEGVELRWQMGTPGLFRGATIERAEAALGPWAPLGLEARDEGGFMVVLDRGVAPGRTYYYRLCATTASGERMTFGPLTATMDIPIREFSLAPVAPNPNSGLVRIEYTVPRESWLRLSVLDLQGREVAVLTDGRCSSGRYQATWNAQTSWGRAPAGVYFLRFWTEGRTMMRRMVLMR
jgi:hypothetical protein